MKVKMISRNPDNYVRETKLQQHKSKFIYEERPRYYKNATFSAQELRSFAASFGGSQGIRACPECHQVGSSICQTLRLQFERASRWSLLLRKASQATFHLGHRRLWRRSAHLGLGESYQLSELCGPRRFRSRHCLHPERRSHFHRGRW